MVDVPIQPDWIGLKGRIINEVSRFWPRRRWKCNVALPLSHPRYRRTSATEWSPSPQRAAPTAENLATNFHRARGTQACRKQRGGTRTTVLPTSRCRPPALVIYTTIERSQLASCKKPHRAAAAAKLSARQASNCNSEKNSRPPSRRNRRVCLMRRRGKGAEDFRRGKATECGIQNPEKLA